MRLRWILALLLIVISVAVMCIYLASMNSGFGIR